MPKIKKTKPRGRNRIRTASRSSRAGLVFPISRVESMMRALCPGLKVGPRTSIFVTAALQRVVGDIVGDAQLIAVEQRARRLCDKHLAAAVRRNPSLHAFFSDMALLSTNVR